jgi:hypothetical protein
MKGGICDDGREGGGGAWGVAASDGRWNVRDVTEVFKRSISSRDIHPMSRKQYSTASVGFVELGRVGSREVES